MKRLLLILIILAVAACSGDDGSGGIGGCGGGIICGQWSGTWISAKGQGNGTIYLSLSQNKITVSAQGYLTTPNGKISCSGSGTITEEKSDGEIILTLSFPATGQTIELRGAYNDKGMAGNYTNSDGDQGNFNLTKP